MDPLRKAVDDLTARFIINLPKEELESVERVCFQVEQAHWFYLDFLREDDPSLPNLGPKQFASVMFQQCSLLRPWLPHLDEVLRRFSKYKKQVPVAGCILMNWKMDQVVLVQGTRGGWGFPKGKINENEDIVRCASREVLEETGYCADQLLDPDAFLEVKSADKTPARLYVVVGVPQDTVFQTRTRNEIMAIQWWSFAKLLKLADTSSNSNTTGGGSNRSNKQPQLTGLAVKFLKLLVPFVKRVRQQRKKQGRSAKAAAASDLTNGIGAAATTLPSTSSSHLFQFDRSKIFAALDGTTADH